MSQLITPGKHKRKKKHDKDQITSGRTICCVPLTGQAPLDDLIYHIILTSQYFFNRTNKYNFVKQSG